MAIRFLPDAVGDLRALQSHLLRHWGESAWIEAQTEIVDRLTHVDEGRLIGAVVPELQSIGILDYRQVTTSHHRLIYRRLEKATWIYLVAAHRQDFPALLQQRLFRR